mmetsp:Transcript_9635/g.22508  ORF Transcript_9635/g.22508 Transcript_9635/m.22508 type:complete len:180 (+) Transcript_9635:366-905(+)
MPCARLSFFKHLYPVVEAILTHFDHAMHFPQTAEELADAERVMSDTWGHNMRGAIAALDGLVVRVRKPWMSTAPSAFFNQKGYSAIVVRAMCDGNRKFCMMSAEHQGACPDATAWNTSSFFNSATGLAARGGVPAPYFILADAAYGLTEYILTPYDGNNLPADKDSYNFWHSHYRMNIE